MKLIVQGTGIATGACTGTRKRTIKLFYCLWSLPSDVLAEALQTTGVKAMNMAEVQSCITLT